jgi:hypothetical protein
MELGGFVGEQYARVIWAMSQSIGFCIYGSIGAFGFHR